MIATSSVLSTVNGHLGRLSVHGRGGLVHVRPRRKYTTAPSVPQEDCKGILSSWCASWQLNPDYWGPPWQTFASTFQPQLRAAGFKRPSAFNLWLQSMMQAEYISIFPTIFPWPPASFERQPSYTITYASARATPVGNLAVDLTLTKSLPLPSKSDHEIVIWYDSESISSDVFSPPRHFGHVGQQYMDDSPTQNITWTAGPAGHWNTDGGDAFFFRLKLFSRFDLVSTIGTYRLITVPW